MAFIKTFQRRNALFVITCIVIAAVLLSVRLGYLMLVDSHGFGQSAVELHERERSIKAERGIIYDRNGVVLADNKPVCTISVIHNQIKDEEKVIEVLSEYLGLSKEYVTKRVQKVTALERIKTNVDKETADKIRELKLAGVMVDEDYKRFYPFDELASKVLGFTGSDNQGIVGLEVYYNKWLSGIDGKILTMTTAHGTEIPYEAENRIEPVKGNTLITSLDINVQSYAYQIANKVMEAKNADGVSVIVMNPQNGEILACVDTPEYNLNEPFVLQDSYAERITYDENGNSNKQDLLNEMWRNGVVSDTYEPGSAFKIITATAALEHNVLSLNDTFYCPGYKIVEDRRIGCHKRTGHGSETFVDGIKNSCNPVFMEVGARVGIDGLYETFRKVGLFDKTGIDLPGEANSIMHKAENVGAVELATISFGQSFQITALQLMSAVSTIVNGGNEITPHFGVKIVNNEQVTVKTLDYSGETGLVSKETSETMKDLLEKVVSEGTGKRAYLPGMRIGGKTATSEKLPRSENKYIASFIGFAPADNPTVIAMILIDEPEGIYYGGTIAAPAIAELFDLILPYLGI